MPQTELIEKRAIAQAHRMFLAAQRANVYAHLDVTSEQIGMAHACSAIGGTYFQVENSRGLTNDEGELIEYRVSWSYEYGYQCDCPSGKRGWANVHHKSGVCWHVRSACARAIEMREATATPSWVNPSNETSYHTGTRAHLLLTGNTEADDRTYARVMNATPSATSTTVSGYQPKAFSPLK